MSQYIFTVKENGLNGKIQDYWVSVKHHGSSSLYISPSETTDQSTWSMGLLLGTWKCMSLYPWWLAPVGSVAVSAEEVPSRSQLSRSLPCWDLHLWPASLAIWSNTFSLLQRAYVTEAVLWLLAPALGPQIPSSSGIRGMATLTRGWGSCSWVPGAKHPWRAAGHPLAGSGPWSWGLPFAIWSHVPGAEGSLPSCK